MVVNVDGYESIVDKQYLFYYLKTITFKSMISGSGQPQIVRKPLVNLLISLPELNTQVKYRSIIDTTMKQKEYFNCSSYRKQKKSTCTSHQITVEAIEEIVLSYLKRVSNFVIDHEGDFVDIAIQHSRLLSRKEVAKKARQVSEAENRIKALNKIIQSLYEDKVMGKITEERFALMSEAYEQEQRQLKETVENSQSEIDRYDEINDNINNFVSLVVKTGRIKKLTPEIVRLLIDKVIVSEKVKTEDGYKRTVTICLTHVGEIDLP